MQQFMQKNIEIAEGIYWVGEYTKNGTLQCNPYLIVDGDEGILIDPGSVLDFESVYKNVTELIPIENIKYVVLSHPDPDLCSSTPLFEQKGLKAELVSHWRSAILINYYGVKSKFYIVNEHENKLVLNSGRVINFILTPYLHFAGSIAAYDSKTTTLFSSDLFGSLAHKGDFYADETYIESMKAFHEHYMPNNKVIKPVMELFLAMDISMIAPQHGCVIKNNIEKFIIALRDLECGVFLNPIKKKLAIIGGYMSICNDILKRLYAIFDISEVKSIFENTKITLDNKTLLIIDFNLTGEELWNYLFKIIYDKKGIEWLEILEPFVNVLIKEYEIPVPKIFNSPVMQSKKMFEELIKENANLKNENKSLQENIKNATEKSLKCPITGLYNFTFLKHYLLRELPERISTSENGAFMLIELDNPVKINVKFGKDAGDEVLKGIAYILEELKEELHFISRADGPAFAYYIPLITPKSSLEFADKIRIAIDRSTIFLDHITVSIGLVNLNEFFSTNTDFSEIFDTIYNLSKARVRTAKSKGINSVCNESSFDIQKLDFKKIMLIDNLNSNLALLGNHLKEYGFNVITFLDGKEALDAIEQEKPDLIVSEVRIPKIDGFTIREKMLMSSTQKKIPFILISHSKDEESISRAISLDISYFFKKPFILSELLGVIRNILKEE